MTENDIKHRDINITGVEIKETTSNVLYTIVDGKVKYKLWQKKADGTSTKAFQQWEQFQLGVGKRVQAGVKEEPQSFTNKEGKQIDFTSRTIMFFRGDEHDVPYQQDVKVDEDRVNTDTLIEQAMEAHVREYHTPSASGGIDPDDLDF